MDQVRVAPEDLDVELQRIVREGNAVLHVERDDDAYVVRYVRRTEIREAP